MGQRRLKNEDHDRLVNRDSKGQHSAKAIQFNPTGGVFSTDVQAAIQELDRKKLDTNFGNLASVAWALAALGITVWESESDTISGGATTLNSTAWNVTYTIDTEGGAGSDDLATINGGVEGQKVYIQAANDARTVVVKAGTGNIYMRTDFSLDNTKDKLVLLNIGGSEWHEVSRVSNGS